MSDAETKGLLLMLKGMVSDMPEADQTRIKEHAQALRDLIASDQRAVVALAIVSAEMDN